MGGLFKKFAERYVPAINQEISAMLSSLRRDHDIVGAYYRKIFDYILAGGKRLRPLIVLATFWGLGGEKVSEIIRAAISVEFMHNSSLVHDDIMDESESRRGRPALHVDFRKWFYEDLPREKKYKFSPPRTSDISLGILGGDSLLELGIEALLTSGFSSDKIVKAVSEYTTAYRKLIEGQTLDMYLSGLTMPSAEEIIHMLELKTGALFSASFKIGAILAGKEGLLDDLDELGKLLGVGFQVRDDILGLFGDPHVTGKPVDSDVKEGKRTLLVVKAYEILPENDRKRLVSVLGKVDLTENELEFVREVVKRTGSLSYSELLAEKYSERCIDLIDDIGFSEEYSDILKDVVRLAVKRSH